MNDDQEKTVSMTLVETMKADIERFQTLRDNVLELSGDELLESLEEASEETGQKVPEPPYLVLVDDELVALLDKKGELAPLPYAMEPERLVREKNGDTARYSFMMTGGSLMSLVAASHDADYPDVEAGEAFEARWGQVREEAWATLEELMSKALDILGDQTRKKFVARMAILHDDGIRAGALGGDTTDGNTVKEMLKEASQEPEQLMQLMLVAASLAVNEIVNEVVASSLEE